MGVPIPGMPVELGMLGVLMPLPLISLLEEELDFSCLELVKLVALVTFGISLGRSAGTFIETDCSDISCLPPFLREMAREGVETLPEESA